MDEEPRWLLARTVGHRERDGDDAVMRVDLVTPDGVDTVASLDIDSAIQLAADLMCRVIETGRQR